MSENYNYKALWNGVMAEVKSEVGDDMFNRWFDITFIEASDYKLKITVPSQMHLDQINSRFKKLIESKLNVAAERNVHLTIGISDSKAKKHADAPLREERHYSEDTACQRVQKSNSENKTSGIQLSEEFTFDNYITGTNNDIAVNASLAISKSPGTLSSYNPLLLYGGVGLGKTHLIQAIANYLVKDPDKKVVYTTADSFITDFTDSIREGQSQMKIFNKKYRSIDVLLIDDIHFLEKKAQTQEALFNIFNHLKSAKKQMVFTSDRHPNDFNTKGYTERLTSRLGSGLSVVIDLPEYETRRAILEKKIEAVKISHPKVEIASDVIDLVCSNVITNTRDMVAALNKLIAYADFNSRVKNVVLTVDIAKKQLKDIFYSPKQSDISVEKIIQIIAAEYGIQVKDIKGKKRTKNITYPRQIAMHISKNITNFSTTEIGEYFGGRDHTTVLHEDKKIEDIKQSSPAEEVRIQNLIKFIKENGVD